MGDGDIALTIVQDLALDLVALHEVDTGPADSLEGWALRSVSAPLLHFVILEGFSEVFASSCFFFPSPWRTGIGKEMSREMIAIYRCVLPTEVPLIVKICVQGKVVCNQLLICSSVPNTEKLCLQS